MICAARRLTNRHRADLNPVGDAIRERKMIGKIDPKRTNAGSRGWSNSISATDPLIRIIVLAGITEQRATRVRGHAV